MASCICRVVAIVASLRCMSREQVDPGLDDVVEIDPALVRGVRGFADLPRDLVASPHCLDDFCRGSAGFSCSLADFPSDLADFPDGLADLSRDSAGSPCGTCTS